MRPEIFEFSDGIPVKAFVRKVEQYPYHWHDTLEIIQVLEGTVNIGAGDDDLLLHEGDVAVINMGELHRIKKLAGGKMLLLEIDPNYFQSLLKDNKYLFIYCCSAYHKAQEPESERYRILKEYITRLVHAFIANPHGSAYKANIENILKDMLEHLTYNFDFLRWAYGSTPLGKKYVERLRQMAESVIGNDEVNLGLKELAAAFEISPYHLSHAIKEKFGVTFMKLLNYSKCERAAKLLLSTNRRIVDIALECGFSDVKYLIKYFKQFFRYNPSEFRTMYRADVQTLVSQAQYRDLPFPVQ